MRLLQKFALFFMTVFVPVLGHAVVTPTAIPTTAVPGYYYTLPNGALNAGNAVIHTTEYLFDATAVDAGGSVLQGVVGTHALNPVMGYKIPFGAWVQNVVQGPTETAFTDAGGTADFNFGCGTGASAGGHNYDWASMNDVAGMTGMTDLSSEAAGDLADLGVNWWRYVGMDDYDALNVVDPESLPVSVTIDDEDLLTGKVRFIISWYLPSTAQKHR